MKLYLGMRKIIVTDWYISTAETTSGIFKLGKKAKVTPLLIGKENGAQSFVRWEIEEHDGGSKLTITVYPFILANLPKDTSIHSAYFVGSNLV